MNLSETMKKMLAARKVVEVGINPDNPSYLALGRELLLNQAKAEVRELTVELTKIIENVSGGVFISGPGAQKFADLAEDEGAVVVDASALYTTIADPVERVLVTSDRYWRIDCLQAMYGVLSKYADKLGIRWMKPLDTSKYVDARLLTREDTVQAVRNIVRTALADDLNVMVLKSDVVEKIIKDEYNLNVVPVIVLNATADEIPGLATAFGNRSITVTAKENAEKNDVITAFLHLKPQFKKTTVTK
jgi:hypothetical protein